MTLRERLERILPDLLPARESEAKRGTVDFSKEVAMTKRILERSNIRKFKQ